MMSAEWSRLLSRVVHHETIVMMPLVERFALVDRLAETESMDDLTPEDRALIEPLADADVSVQFAYNRDQPRDARGRWGSGGGPSAQPKVEVTDPADGPYHMQIRYGDMKGSIAPGSGWKPDDPEIAAMFAAAVEFCPPSMTPSDLRLTFGSDVPNAVASVNSTDPHRISVADRDVWDTEQMLAKRREVSKSRVGEGDRVRLVGSKFVREHSETTLERATIAHEMGHVLTFTDGWTGVGLTEKEMTNRAYAAIRVFAPQWMSGGGKTSNQQMIDAGMSSYGTYSAYEAIAETHAAYALNGFNIEPLRDRPLLAAIVVALDWEKNR